MKQIKCRKKFELNKDILVLLVIMVTIVMYIFLSFKYTNYLKKVLPLKLEEQFAKIIKNTIDIENYDLSNIIKVNLDNNMIKSIDVNNNLLNDMVKNIQSNMNNELLLYSFFNNKNFYYYKMPILISNNNVLISNLGSKIPVRVDCFKNMIGFIKTDVKGYGINNSIIKVYLQLNLDQSFYFPFVKKIKRRKIEIELGTKVINGNVPYFYSN